MDHLLDLRDRLIHVVEVNLDGVLSLQMVNNLRKGSGQDGDYLLPNKRLTFFGSSSPYDEA
jgi:hypothetical protein